MFREGGSYYTLFYWGGENVSSIISFYLLCIKKFFEEKMRNRILYFLKEKANVLTNLHHEVPPMFQ